jgi:signal transduction histidine kinase
MKINDNGKGLPVDRARNGHTNNRLGLLGMRERLEMAGGSFTIESAPGKGTTVTAQIPLGDAALKIDARGNYGQRFNSMKKK